VWTLVVEVHAVPVGWFFIFIEEKGWHRRSRGTPRDVAAPGASSNFLMRIQSDFANWTHNLVIYFDTS
jgi:hypothetical protein